MPATVHQLPAAAPVVDPAEFVLPHNLEAERSVLGAALLDVHAADYVVDHLTPEAFFRRAHKEVFAAVRALRDRHVTPDLLTAKGELERRNKLEAVGVVYFSQLTDGVPRSTNVAHYAAILRDLEGRRALAAYATRTLGLIQAGAHGAADILRDADRRLLELQAGHVEERMQPLRASTSALLDNLEWRVAHRGQVTGVPTGFVTLDNLTQGWQPGDLIVIGARPSIGKTSFAINAAVHGAAAGKRAAVFSLEMRRQQLEYRILAQLSQIPLMNLLSGILTEAQYARLAPAIGTMSELPLEIDDRSGVSVWDIRAACRRLKGSGGLDQVVIDYAQLMPGSLDRRGATRNEEMTDISRRLKEMADELGVPVILLSQLSRKSSDRPDPTPRLSDLRESGALEQDADNVAFLHRKHHREGGTTKLILEKQRTGPTGTILLNFDRETTTFTDAGEELAPEPVPVKPKPEKTIAEKYNRRRRS